MTIDKDKIGRLLILIGAVGLIVGVLVFLATRGQSEASQSETPQNAFQEVPEAEVSSIQSSKSAAYRDHREAKEDSSIENYWDKCMEEEEDTTNEQTARTPMQPSSPQQPKTSTELFGGGSTPSPAPRSSSGYTNPYRETPQQREERHQKRHEEAIELANQQTAMTILRQRQMERTTPLSMPSSQTPQSDVLMGCLILTDGTARMASALWMTATIS